MNLSLGRPYRLSPRNEAGLSCDEDGITLGGVPLVRLASSDGRVGAQVRPLGDLATILRLAYGNQTDEAAQRCHRGLRRAATQFEAGDLALAALEALMVGFPELAPPALAKLARFADLDKAGDAWEDQPRVSAGPAGGGQWTSDGKGGGTSGAVQPNAASPERPAQDAGRPALPLDDGVYRPSRDRPVLTPTGGGPEAAEDGWRRGIGGNEPPYDPLTLQDIFPGLKDEPGVALPLAPIDSFLGLSAAADAASLAATEGLYLGLVKQIRAIDPNWHDDEILPPGGLAGLSPQGRNNLISSLRVQRAVALYQQRGDIRALQVETFRFLQGAVDRAYAQAVQEYGRGELRVPLSRALAIGNRVDVLVRQAPEGLYNTYGIRFGRGQIITVNNRDVSSIDQTYKRPDARLAKVSFDWSLVFKTFSDAQVRGFFRADSAPDAVVIIRPSQLDRLSAYLIPRPPGEIRKGDLWFASINKLFQNHSVV